MGAGSSRVVPATVSFGFQPEVRPRPACHLTSAVFDTLSSAMLVVKELTVDDDDGDNNKDDEEDNDEEDNDSDDPDDNDGRCIGLFVREDGRRWPF